MEARGEQVLAPQSADDAAAATQAAVEQFIELRSSGSAVDPAKHAAQFRAELRSDILARCREYLAFDGLVGTQEWQAPAADTSERRFGDFVIEGELGRGGMGVVYLARQVSLHRQVALKVMAAGLTLSHRHVERFRREAAAAAQVKHQAIVAVHSLHEVEGSLAIAMDFVAGRNLGDCLDELRLGAASGAMDGKLGIAPEKGYVAECALLATQLASALAAAHNCGVVHRDLKPRNLMIDDRGQVRLLDFGLAKSLGDGSISLSGEITGTVHYMSPEQTLAKRVEVDHRSDIFALGVILYELLTLRRPFEGKNLQQIVYEICFKEPVPPQQLNAKVPSDLATICLKALEKDPKNRYATASELEADLQRFLRWEPIHAKPAGSLARVQKWLKRHRVETLAGLAVAAISIGFLMVDRVRTWQDEREADRLLQVAETLSLANQPAAALEAVTKALGKRDDAATRKTAELYQQMMVTAAKQAEVDRANAANLCRASLEQLSRDRRLAIQLALAAHQVVPSVEARSAVLRALGGGFGSTQFAHGMRRLHGAQWSPDGTMVVTFGVRVAADGKEEPLAVLWTAAGQRQHELRGHGAWINASAFTPDSRRLLTVSHDATLRVWDTATGQELALWRHETSARSILLSADGGVALTTGDDSRRHYYGAKAWRVADGTCLATFATHTQFVTAAAIAPSGKLAVTAGDSDLARLWRCEDGKEIAVLGGFVGIVSAAAFSADESVVCLGGADGQLRCYAVADGSLLASAGHGGKINSLQFAPQGLRLVSASDDRTARVWNVDLQASRLREVATLVGARDGITSARFAADGQRIAVAGSDGVARVHDVAGPELFAYEAGDSILRDAAFDPTGQQLLFWHRAGAVAWQLQDARGVVTLRQPGVEVPAAAFVQQSQQVLTGGDDEVLRLWEAHSRQLVATSEPLGNPVTGLAVDPLGHCSAVATVNGQVSLHSLADGKQLQILLPAPRKRVVAVRFCATGQTLLTVDQGGEARLWERHGEQFTCEHPIMLGGMVAAADLCADGKSFVVLDGAEPKQVRWYGRNGTLERELRSDQPLTALACRPDGQAVLVGSSQGIMAVLARDGTRLRELVGQGRITTLAWSSDGSKILSGAARDSNLARLWDASSGELCLAFSDHLDAVVSVAFSPDGKWAVSTSRDRTARVWPTDPVAVAQALALPPLSELERTRTGIFTK